MMRSMLPGVLFGAALLFGELDLLLRQTDPTPGRLLEEYDQPAAPRYYLFKGDRETVVCIETRVGNEFFLDCQDLP